MPQKKDPLFLLLEICNTLIRFENKIWSSVLLIINNIHIYRSKKDHRKRYKMSKILIVILGVTLSACERYRFHAPGSGSQSQSQDTTEEYKSPEYDDLWKEKLGDSKQNNDPININDKTIGSGDGSGDDTGGNAGDDTDGDAGGDTGGNTGGDTGGDTGGNTGGHVLSTQPSPLNCKVHLSLKAPRVGPEPET